MKIRYLLLICVLAIKIVSAQNSISGKITDDKTGEALIGAIVYIPDLKSGVTTDLNGVYKIGNLPPAKFIIEVKYIGYITIDEVVDFATVTARDFKLKMSAIEAKGVVITGSALSSDNSRTSVTIVPIDKRELQTTPSSNIIDALANIPGISQVTSGGSISKPVIRGLGYNRVVTISEGTRQEGNQWGDEHGIEIDQFSADRIEVLKGPASLFYGSDAMGGVINILEPIPAMRGTIGGEFGSSLSSNNLLTSNSLMNEGNVNGFIWRVRGSVKSSASYRTPDEYVYNSGYNETNAGLMAGLNKRWGYSHFHYSIFDTHIGIVEGERDSATNKFVDAGGQIVPDNILKGRKPDLPFQHVIHHKLSSVSNIIVGKDQLKLAFGYQLNDRKEHVDSRTEPGLFFRLGTITADIKYQQLVSTSIEAVYGISGMFQSNVNKGVEFLVPDYQSKDFGGFVYAKKSMKKLTLNAGIRIDHRSVHGDELTGRYYGHTPFVSDTILRDFTSNFSAVSGSTGMTYKFSEKFNVKFNVGRAFRSPNIAELASNGVHEGTFRYEVGNSNLKAETSLQFDGDITYSEEYYQVSVDAFYNTIDNFIYQRNIGSESWKIGNQNYPVYRFVQGNSVLKGFEANVDIHPKDHFHFENSISLVEGENKSLGEALPWIPATHTRHVFRWNIEAARKSVFRNPYVYFGGDWYWKQNRYDMFETETGSYVLYSLGTGSDLRIGQRIMTLFVAASNLTNVKYYDHLSRLKYAGVYNMGRNVTFGLTIPFGIATLKER